MGGAVVLVSVQSHDSDNYTTAPAGLSPWELSGVCWKVLVAGASDRCESLFENAAPQSAPPDGLEMVICYREIVVCYNGQFFDVVDA